MNKRLMSLIVALCLFCSMVPMLVRADGVTEFAGGSGTVEDPYLVETKVQLNNVRNHLDSHFRMVSNIAFSDNDFSENGMFYNEGQGWEPIGSSSNEPFCGGFDGDGYAIIGMKINIENSKSTDVSCGLFGYGRRHASCLWKICGRKQH